LKDRDFFIIGIIGMHWILPMNNSTIK